MTRLRSLATLVSDRRGVVAGVVVLAALTRAVPLALGPGLHAFRGYDDGVYYTAAASLTFGRVPYRDFLLLHPPGIVLVLAPFALLGRLTSDATGLAAARVAFMCLGAFNAGLIAWISSRWGRLAAAVAGVTYACWYHSIGSEQTTYLEPLGTTAVLLALLLLLRREATPIQQIAAGASIGLGAGIKIWGVVPWLVVIAWQWRAAGVRSAARIAAAGVVALTVLLLPFFVLAPTRMFDMVVRDQLRRNSIHAGFYRRLSDIFAVVQYPAVWRALAVAALVLAICGAAWLCVRVARAGVCVGLLFATAFVLLASPSFFNHYSEFVAAPIALVLGIGTAAARKRFSLLASVPRPVLAVTGTAVAGALGLALMVSMTRLTPFPTAQFDAAAPAGCVAADTDIVLIEMNRLTSDLRAGCPVAADVSGATYDWLYVLNHKHQERSRGRNKGWQRFLLRYLTSDSAFVVARPRDDHPSPATARDLSSFPVLARDGRIVLRAGDGMTSPATPPRPSQSVDAVTR